MRRFTLILPLLAGCAPAARPAPADTVFTGGMVRSMALDGATAQALAVRDGRVVFVGSGEGAAAYEGEGTRVVDLAGRTVIPGLIDSHAHLVWGGEDLQIVDLSVATSMEELLAAVSAWAAANPGAEWVQGSGWDAPTFEGQMDKALLDAIIPDRPVYLGSADGHSAWVNSVALALAGITDETADPPGGIIVRDDSGEATGVLRESAEELVLGLIPPFTEEEDDAGLAQALELAHSHGITTVIDANCAEEVLGAYLRADAAGTLKLRVYGAVEVLPTLDPQVDAIVAERDDITSDLVHVDAVKLYLDGVIESGTAYLQEPYSDGTNAAPLFSDAQLDRFFLAADDAGLQIHLHAVGDGAVHQLLDAIERLDQVTPVAQAADRRTLAAHIELIDPADVPRFAELGVYADFQPLWAYPDTYIVDLTLPVIGDERAAWLYTIGDVVASGATVVAGSDWDVSDINPFAAMEVAITRQDPDDPGEALGPEQAVGIDTILAAYTRDGARAVFGEDDLGTLEVGKYADLVIVAQDPYTIDLAALSDLVVESTWVGGAEVFDAGRVQP